MTTSTVAALLTILGYSLYDTIIVFDRVRENMPRMPRAAFSQIVNRSMSEVLTRSLATSFCTLLPVLALLLFGGETLKDFAFALLVGVASGAYSSIFIASPVLTHWKEREPVYRSAPRADRARTRRRVPAYAVATSAASRSTSSRRAAQAQRSASAPDGARSEPGEQLSREEFEELRARPRRRRRRRRAPAPRRAARARRGAAAAHGAPPTAPQPRGRAPSSRAGAPSATRRPT